MSPPPISRILVEDCAADRRIERIVIQEAGIPGPAGLAGTELQNTEFVLPLAYDPDQRRIEITPPPLPGQVYRWSGTAWEPFTLQVRRVENRTLSQAEADDRQLTLAHSVTDPASILFDIANGGGPRFLDADFELLNQRIIRWAGGPLDGVLAHGDRVRVVYE